MADISQREIDARCAPVVAHVIARGAWQAGQRVRDVGTGTGVVAAQAASRVGVQGHVVAVDLSPEMLAAAQQRFMAHNLRQIIVREGRAEAIPVEDQAFDVVLASLSLMYVLDRAAAARELARAYTHRSAVIVYGSDPPADRVAMALASHVPVEAPACLPPPAAAPAWTALTKPTTAGPALFPLPGCIDI